MAETDKEDKKHDPTGRRISEMRQKGQVLRSRELSGGLVLMSVIMLLFYMADDLKATFEKNFLLAYSSISTVVREPENFYKVIKTIAMNNFNQLMPIFISAFFIALLSPFLLGGWNFTLHVLQFKFEKLNPISGLKRLFSIKKSMIEILRSMFKAFFLLGILVVFLMGQKNNIIGLTQESLESGISSSVFIVKSFIVFLAVALCFIIMTDTFYHIYEFQEQSKMTTQEVKDEAKDTEGNVDVKRKIRSKQFALLKQRLLLTVPKANVIITNPTHYAIALKYDGEKDKAPKVVAKGKDLIASQIRQIAVANAITIYEAPTLARAIYHTTKLGGEVHPALYMAVAIVLSYVYQLKNYQMGQGKLPEYVDDLQIPTEFIYNE